MASHEEALAEKIRDGGPFEISGQGTKRGLGQPLPKLTPLTLKRFASVQSYEPAELVLEAGAATPLDEIEALLARHGQQLPFEPPDYTALLGSEGRGTIGGAIACNLSGPRRLKAGAARDHVLGFTGVNGRGELFKAGGRVVKNVTGFDISKLMAGSFGTLAVMTRIAIKVLPAPEHEETLVVEGASLALATEAMSLALQSACEVSSAAHVEGLTLLRLEGTATSIAHRRDKLAKLLKPVGLVSSLDDKTSRQSWREIRDGAPLLAGDASQVWKIVVPPMQGALLAQELQHKLDAKTYLDWGGGLIWLAMPARDDAGADIVRGALQHGQAMLVKAGAEVRGNVDVFQPLAPAHLALEQRVKASFDPKGKFNPGRMRRSEN